VTPQLSSVGTQTVVRLDLPHLLLMVVSAIVAGSAMAASAGAIYSKLWFGNAKPWERESNRDVLEKIPDAVQGIIMYVVCGTFFNIGVGLYVLSLRRLGFLDHRLARVLGGTWFGGTYRRCCLSQQERYRVMDEGNVPIYAADKRANEWLLRRLSSLLAFAVACLLLGQLSSVLLLGLRPLAANASASGNVTTGWTCDRAWTCAEWAEWTCACEQSGQSGRVHEWTCA